MQKKLRHTGENINNYESISDFHVGMHGTLNFVKDFDYASVLAAGSGAGASMRPGRMATCRGTDIMEGKGINQKTPNRVCLRARGKKRICIVAYGRFHIYIFVYFDPRSEAY